MKTENKLVEMIVCGSMDEESRHRLVVCESLCIFFLANLNHRLNCFLGHVQVFTRRKNVYNEKYNISGPATLIVVKKKQLTIMSAIVKV